MVSWGDREWTVLAGVGGAVSLAMVGAPLSVDMVFLVGPDSPALIGEQFAALFCAALATGVGIVLARRWRWLLLAGSVGMVVAQAIRVPRPQGISVRVGPYRGPAPDIAAHPVWACLLVAAAAVLLVGTLGAAQELLRSSRLGAGIAGFVGCAGYFGVSVVGRLRGIDVAGRFVVVAAMGVVTVLAVLRMRAPGTGGGTPWVSMVAAAAGLVWLLPTMIVAIRGQAIFGTVIGGVVGLVVLAVALIAARAAGVGGMLAVAATGLVLGAPVVILVLLYDVLLTGVWYAWPIAGAGVLVGAVVAAGPWPVRAGIVGAAGLSMVGVAARLVENRSTGQLLIWLFLGLSMAAVAATVGSATQVLARFEAGPALSALGTLAGLGVFGALNLLRAGAGGRAVLGSTVDWTAAGLMFVAAGLLVAIGRWVARQPTSVVRFDRTATER